LKRGYIEHEKDFEEPPYLIECRPSVSCNERGIRYIPHHAVVKMNFSSNKVRMVYDALARPKEGVNHNDIALKGPKIQETLFSIMLRLGCDKYILCPDLKSFINK
jgi:hypothetical protein